jgi:hypothetical protein
MSRARSTDAGHREDEFEALLLTCLYECAAGRWGLFRQNRHPEAARWLRWPEAERLREQALEIRRTRQQEGSNTCACELFLGACDLSGPNVPGEPKLAARLLAALEREP